MEQKPTVVEHIRRKFSGRRSVLGSQLGFALKEYDRTLQLRGALKQYVARELSDCLQWRTKKGLDDVYEFIDNVDSSTMAAAENNKQLWKVFSNPNISGMLISDVKDNRLYVASTLSTAPPGFRQLARLQPEDYRDIAKRFISHLPADLQSQARNVLSQPSFWSQWFWLIRNSAAAQLPEWERTRIAWIEEQFSARLSELGYASADADRWLDELRNSRYLGRPQPQSLTSERAEGRVSDMVTTSLASVAAVPQSRSTLKDLAKKAIDAMTDEEIERIQIPLRLIGYARNPET